MTTDEIIKIINGLRKIISQQNKDLDYLKEKMKFICDELMVSRQRIIALEKLEKDEG